jgi:predicted ABC-type ATPase
LSSTKTPTQLRLRVFAGPNGSGKSTLIQYVRDYKTGTGPIDFGYYINADELAQSLRTGSFDFSQFDLMTDAKTFKATAIASGLINKKFTEETFIKVFKLSKNKLELTDSKYVEQLAQILADFLRKQLLIHQKRFSFETVFSHESKLDIMREAKANGYKVYLYFVSTETPEINKARVLSRKAQGGHDVPPDLIESRYYRSLDFLYEACQIAYQVFFFDNSTDGKESNMYAHFKMVNGKKKWDDMKMEDLPRWFIKYYLGKIPMPKVK